ncbi:hypothetical protein QQM79_04940 [Marinobacteraceae bacterium S3BR75-40.1]
MRKPALFLLSLIATVYVHADTYGVFDMQGEGKMHVYYQDDNHIRIESAEQGYMLVSGDKVYSVVNQGGQTMAMDMSEMGKALSEARKRYGQPDSKEDTKANDVSIERTGKTETVAGFEGQVHEVTVNGEKQTVVLSEDPTVVEVTRGFLKAISRAGKMMDPNGAQETERMMEQLSDTGYGGILKQENGPVLVKAEEVDKPDSFYQLPEGVQLMQMPSQGMMPQAPAQ